MPAVALQNATAGYRGQPILHNIDFNVEPGERVAIMGRSGAGKSTLLNLIYERFADSVALVPQAGALVKTLSVFHNVYMGQLDQRSTLHNLRTLAWPPRGEVEAVSAILDSVGLGDKLFAKAGELSGGQQQRVSVARALFNGRPVVIGDEPVSALDRVQAGDVLAAMLRRHETSIFALHDIRLALEHTDRIVLIERGRIVLDSPARDLTASDLIPYYEDEVR
ncbi:MAG: ATP-binding cassette domain-containing protein [Hyphomicrobiales bacterium]|nr:ATP-binding cassette domain-containing protein [Hyphomicrobiales bacterium]